MTRALKWTVTQRGSQQQWLARRLHPRRRHSCLLLLRQKRRRHSRLGRLELAASLATTRASCEARTEHRANEHGQI